MAFESHSDDSDDSTDYFSDDNPSSPRNSSVLNPDDLLAYSKPFAERRGGMVSVRPENVPALKLKSSKYSRLNARLRSHGKEHSRTIASSLKDDVEHYASLIKGGSEKVAESIQMALLSPIHQTEQGDSPAERIAVCNALVLKLLPAFGIFHFRGTVLEMKCADESENLPQ